MRVLLHSKDEVTDSAMQVLREAKAQSGVDTEFQFAYLPEDMTPPPHAAVLSLGSYQRRGQERVVPTYSVGQLLTKADGLTVMSQAFKLLAGQPDLPEFKYEVIRLEDLQDIGYGDFELTVDIETRGDADAQVPSWQEIISLAWYDGQCAYVLPEHDLQSHHGQWEVYKLLKENRLDAHNGKFDFKYMSGKGMQLYPTTDTMLMHYALYPAASAHDAKTLAKTYFGADDWDSEMKKKYLKKKTYNQWTDLSEVNGEGAYAQAMSYSAKNGYERIPRPILYKYNALDVYWQWHIRQELKRVLAQDENATQLYNYLMELSHMFQRVEAPGNRFDAEYMSDLSEQLTEEYDAALVKFQEMAGWAVNPNSHVQVKKLFHENGYMVADTAKTTMVPLAEDGVELAIVLQELRGLNKENGTYVAGYLDKLIDGRGYGTLKLHASMTGRLGGGGAALLTIPRKKRVKKMVLPDLNEVMVSADLSQAELRVLAVESDDQWMIDAFQPGAADFFDLLLGQAKPEHNWSELHYRADELEDDPGQFYQTWRAAMKGTVYGTSFNRKAKAIAFALGITVPEAQELIDGFVRPGSNFALWREEIERKAVNGEPIINAYGRQFQAEVVSRKNRQSIINSALAFTSQSTANDICLTAALAVEPQLAQYGARMMTTLHDAIYCSVPAENAEAVGKLLVAELEQAGHRLYDGIVPFKSSMKVGGRNMAEV